MTRRGWLLLLSLLLSPWLRAERMVSLPSVGPAFGTQQPVEIAFHGEQGFVLWQDWRSGTYPAPYGARVSADGTLLDPHGIRLGPVRGIARDVVWADGAWIAVWTENRSIYGRRIAADGELLGEPVRLFEVSIDSNYGVGQIDVASNGEAIIVTNRHGIFDSIFLVAGDLSTVRNLSSPHPIIAPSLVTSDGRDFYVVGAQFSHASGIIIAKITPDGDVTQHATGVYGYITSAIWTGRDLAVAAHGFLHRFDRDGTRLSGPIDLAPATGSFSILTRGSEGELIAVWSEYLEGRTEQVYLTRVGDPAGATPQNLGEITHVQRPSGVRGVWMPSGLLLVGDGIRTVLVRGDQTPAVWGEKALRSVTGQVAFAADRTLPTDLFVYADEDGTTSRVMIGHRSGGTRAVHDSLYRQREPSLATNGRTALVTWVEDRPDPARPHVLMALVLGADGLPLAPPQELGALWRPPAAAVWSGSMYLVGWAGRITRITETGILLDEEPAPVFSEGAQQPQFVRVADIVLAIWSEGIYCSMCGLPPPTIHAMRFTSDGSPIDPTPVLLKTSYEFPQVAVNGTAVVLVADHGLILSLDVLGSTIKQQQVGRPGLFRPSVAAHGDGFVVAWSSGGATYAAALTSTLELSGTRRVTADAPEPHAVQVWTTSTGRAAIAYQRVNRSTEWVPRLYTKMFDEPERTRAVRR